MHQDGKQAKTGCDGNNDGNGELVLHEYLRGVRRTASLILEITNRVKPDRLFAKCVELLRTVASSSLVWVVCFGVASSLWCVTTARELGATFDEPTYLTNGMHFWHTGSHRTLMRLGTMPLPVDVQTFPLAVAEWLTGKTWNLETDFRRALIWMRHGNLVFWWLLLIFAYRIARDVGGPWAGRLAVAAIACEPNLLAHASLATTDVAITATTLGYAYYFAKYRESNWARRMVSRCERSNHQ